MYPHPTVPKDNIYSEPGPGRTFYQNLVKHKQNNWSLGNSVINDQAWMVRNLPLWHRTTAWDIYKTSLSLGNGSARRLAKILHSETMESQFLSNADIVDEDYIDHAKGFLRDYFAPCTTDVFSSGENQ